MATTSQPFQATETSDQPFEPIRQIARWFETAVPAPTNRNIHTQLGVHLEELSEMVQALKYAGTTYSAREQLTFAADVLGCFQRQLKDGKLEINFDKINRVTLLDALCDQIVSMVGIVHMLGMDIDGALKAVADSNDSKFDEDGRPIFNDQRKIMKGPRYQSPNLSAYTVKRIHADG